MPTSNIGSAAAAGGIITLSSLKTALSITGSGEDDQLTQIVDGINAAIDGYLGYQLELATYTHYFDGNGLDHFLYVNARPLVSVASVYHTSEIFGGEGNTSVFGDETLLVANDDYIVDLRKGAIVRVKCPWRHGVQNIKVTYSAGHAVIPDDVVAAALSAASQLYKDLAEGGAVSSEKLGDYSISYLRGSQSDSVCDVRRVLNRYRRVVI